jgi:hypothetical protein
MAMPEIAITKDCHLAGNKGKIRSTREFRVVGTVPGSQPMEGSAKKQLRLRIVSRIGSPNFRGRPACRRQVTE